MVGKYSLIDLYSMFYYFWESWWAKWYIISTTNKLTKDQEAGLISLLSLGQLYEQWHEKIDTKISLLWPRLWVVSPANSNLTAAYEALSDTQGVVTNIEWYDIVSSKTPEYDQMTQWVYSLWEVFASAQDEVVFNNDPELLEDWTEDGKYFKTFSLDLLGVLNTNHGLALSHDQMQYFFDLFSSEKYARVPTFSEFHLYAQLNSEHCRHNIFNGRIIVDGEAYEKSMFSWIKDTYKAHPWNVVVAYSDNGAILKAQDDRYIVIKAETHNHPCLIAPVPWWATWSGWCFRDILATGRWSMVEISTSTYCVGDLTKKDPYRSWHQTPSEILQKASYGVNDYGNCFAAPLINGSMIWVLHDMEIWWEIFSHAKPVVMAGSAWWTPVGKVDKQKEVWLIHIKLWWPDYAIGIWWAAASSMNSGENSDSLDFASVQRANPQMQIKVKKVLETIIQSCPDAIRNIHDYGAGGHGTNIFELYEWDDVYPWGGDVDIAKISVEDASMTYHQILINESQERLGLLIHPDYLEQITSICEREKCPFDVLWKATGTGRVRMIDSRSDTVVVDVDVKDFLLWDRIEYQDTRPSTQLENLDIAKIRDIDLLDILRHPTVGSKGYIVHHVDRSVRGKIVQQQTVWRRQFPLADYGLFKSDTLSVRGTATAQWMRPYHTIISPKVMSQRALAETILNISFVKSAWLDALSLSGNWMRSAKHPSGKASLYEAVESLSIHTQELWINIPVGKDSMSMKVTTDEGEDINAPGTLVLSAFVHVPDVSKHITPELKNSASRLVRFPCINKDNLEEAVQWWLNGSVSSWMTKQLGDTLPEVQMEDVKNLYHLIQELLEKNMLLAWHDISEGWLWSCLTEMYIAWDIETLDIDLPQLWESTQQEILLSEYPGVVLQMTDCTNEDIEQLTQTYGLTGIVVANIEANTSWDAAIRIRHALESDKQDTRHKQSLIDARCEYNTKVSWTKTETTFVLPEFKVSEIPTPIVVGNTKPKVMILRDEWTNGEHDMHTAFGLAWFDPVDVTITDLQQGRTKIDQYEWLALPWWFSYGDRPRSGKSFADIIRLNPVLSKQFDDFRRSEKFVLWVCNGNQVLMELGRITDSYDMKVHPMEHNDTQQFESRFLALGITDTDNRFFTGMDDWILPIRVAHGEWRYADLVTSNKQVRMPVKYVDHASNVTTQFPYNPNGSHHGVAWVLSADGNILGMMPHPERTILPHQLAWTSPWVEPEQSTWLQMFKNLRSSV